MTNLRSLLVVLLVLIARPAAADDADTEAAAESLEKVFDWTLPDDLDATYAGACETADCKVQRIVCDALYNASSRGQYWWHGTNVVMICSALHKPIFDTDLNPEAADRIARECTREPSGAYCASIGPMCTRNRDEGWRYPQVKATCEAATAVGAGWDRSASDSAQVVASEIWPDMALDNVFLNTASLEIDCEEGRPECAERRKYCQDFVELGGGYIYMSYIGDQCRAVGVPGPARDLHADELAGVQTWCRSNPTGPACTSLQHACQLLGPVDADHAGEHPNLAMACQAMASVHGSATKPAGASPPKPPAPGINDFAFALAVGRVGEPAQLGDTTTTILADLAVHGLVGLNTVAPAIAVGAAAGSTTGGGFLYDLAIGFGVGLRVGDDGMIMVTIGGGLGGITGGRLGFAWEVPVDAYIGLPVGRALRVVLGARGAWVFKEDPRQDGAADVPIFDEVQGRFGVNLHRRDRSLIGLYAFASQARETTILGLALSFGQVQVETGAPPLARGAAAPTSD